MVNIDIDLSILENTVAWYNILLLIITVVVVVDINSIVLRVFVVDVEHIPKMTVCIEYAMQA